MGNGSRIGGFSSPFGSTGIHIGGWHHSGGNGGSSSTGSSEPTPETVLSNWKNL